MMIHSILSRVRYHGNGIFHIVLYALRALLGVIIISIMVICAAVSYTICLPILFYQYLCNTLKN